jgi:hypothetical protein
VDVSETAVVAVITGAFTLISGLGGVAISQMYSKKQFLETIRAQRHTEVRALVAECVDAGLRYVETQEPFVVSLTGAKGSVEFFQEWAESDSGRRQAADVLAVTRTAGELRLLVSDKRLLDALASVTELIKHNRSTLVLVAELQGRGTWSPETLAAVHDHMGALKAAFQTVESRAAELLRGDL